MTAVTAPSSAGELRAAGVCKLIDMHAQAESVLFRGQKNAAGIVDRKYVRLAKDVAKLSERFRSGKHLLDHEMDVFFAPATNSSGISCAPRNVGIVRIGPMRWITRNSFISSSSVKP